MKRIFLILIVFTVSTFLASCNKIDDKLFLLSPGDDFYNVRQQIYLKTELNGSIVTWSSSNQDYITDSGLVNRPTVDENDVEVRLTANYKNKIYDFDFIVTKKTGDIVYDLYPSINDENHIIEIITYDRLIELLNVKDEALIYLGFESCPWCKEYLPIFHRMAKNNGFEVIYYYDFREIRKIEGDKLNTDFFNLISLINEEFLVDHPTNPNFKWLFAPTFIGISNQKIQALFTGAIKNHQANESYMTISQSDELKLIFFDIISQTRPSSCVC